MSAVLPPFKNSSQLTIGTELELQLVNLQNFNLAMEAEDFLRRLSTVDHPCEFKPEITQSMIEINSSPHLTYESLQQELRRVQKILSEEAKKSHIGICGGGTHPFQKWHQQRIFSSERFDKVSDRYGYLAKQTTIFSQHIHIACPNGDDALYLCHAMAPYIPHFIALAASSPFHQGVDTAFDCSRLTIISAYPTSGMPPWIFSWEEFIHYFDKVARTGIASSMKDFYWDIRPKPEYGTIELRICDVPLTVDKAADLATYMQLLIAWFLDERQKLSQEVYLTYPVNRFLAARYGLEALLLTPSQEQKTPLSFDILKTCKKLEPYAKAYQAEQALAHIWDNVHHRTNDAAWLRKYHQKYHYLSDIVRVQTERWMNNNE